MSIAESFLTEDYMEKDYLSSCYNYVSKSENRLLLYNSKSGRFAAIENADKNISEFLLQGGVMPKQIDSKLQEFLISKKYVVRSLQDEKEEIVNNYQSVIDKNELFLEILPTEQCNFRCIYCYENFQKGCLDKVSVKGIINFVNSNIENCTALRIAWFGGEPLLAMDVIENLTEEFINICRKNHVPYFSSMTTNGYLLSPDMIKRVKKCHITNFQITIDGLENEHDQQRVGKDGRKTWAQIISNLKYIKSNILSSTIHIMVRTNITREIYENRYAYIAFLEKTFADDKRFTFFFHLAEDWGNIEDDVKKKFCGTNEFYEILELAAEHKLSLEIFQYFLTPESRVCFAGRKKAFVITPDGGIHKCSFRLDDQKNFITNVKNMEINHKDCLPMPYYKNLLEVCKKCKKLPLCYGLVCPSYSKSVTETCGYDLSDIERLVRILYKSNPYIFEAIRL